jgi:transitional endoplasmic reticulum ATPase
MTRGLNSPFPAIHKLERAVGRLATPICHQPDAAVRLYAMRLLVHAGGSTSLVTDTGYARADVAAALGLEARCPSGDETFQRTKALSALHDLLDEEERRVGPYAPPFPQPLERNLERLGDLAGLPPLHRRCLGLSALMRADRVLSACAEFVGALTVQRVHEVLADALGEPIAEVRAALGTDSPLHRSGLLCVDPSGTYSLTSKIDLITPGFAERIVSDDCAPLELLAAVITPPPAAELPLEAFGHVGDLPVVLAYLRDSIANGRSGVNVLLFGRPGVGKTQLALRLATECGALMHEVPSAGPTGDPLTPAERVRSYRCAQQMLGRQQPAMLLFDELEDIIGSGDPPLGKAWFNRALETNRVPTVFVSNSIDELDPAHARRFDIVLEIKAPDPAQRRSLVRQLVGDMLSETAVAEIASRDGATPAVVTRARRVIDIASSAIAPTEREPAYRRLISQTLRAQGQTPLAHDEAAEAIPDTYDPRATNADGDLVQIADGLARAGAGRLLLWGPPGTGKSSIGRWLAQRLGVPLQTERGSTLLGGIVGETEAHIAAAFRNARERRALLMIDECDTFLMSRRHAQRSWEISHVNEMLVQIESFDGLLLMSTNLIDVLDDAVLRRFDLKLRLGYLRPEQSLALLERHCAALALAAPCEPARRQLMGLANLTPGDFATVARQHRFRPLGSAADFVAQLRNEARLKDGPARQPLGFVA